MRWSCCVWCWLSLLIAQVLASRVPAALHGRLIRIIDATAVPKAGAPAKRGNGVWRVHSAFDLPSERFGAFELTDEKGSERLDRIPVVEGEIRLADRVYLHPDHLAAVIDAGGDLVVRAGWKSARWLEPDGTSLDLPNQLSKAAAAGLMVIDRLVALARNGKPAFTLRLVAARKSPQAAEAARRNARRQAQRGGHHVTDATLIAADWVILITSLPETYTAQDILALYRLRWRIELAFKRLKSLIGLKGPPGSDPRSARPYVLAHLLMILLLEPIIDELEDSPRSATAA